jgi:hypothetical protein
VKKQMLSFLLLIQNTGRLRGLLSVRDNAGIGVHAPGINMPSLPAGLMGWHGPSRLAVDLA